jgi:mono/diheme cytochrome c family protein
MIRFLIGFLTAVVLVLLTLFCYVRFGFVDPRADAEPGSLETKLAMPALDASVDRRAPDMKNPIQLTEENLLAGMKIYQADCAGCHGDISHPHSTFGGWKSSLKESEVWQVTTFLSKMNKLPPRVLDAWKTAATEPGTSASAEAGTKATSKDRGMDMSAH